MTQIDLKRELKELYNPSAKEVSIVDVPDFQYLMIDGEGPPDGSSAKAAISALFPVAYKIKFAKKKSGKEYKVMPLEGLWWADDMNSFVQNKRDQWKWTYMIMQPDFATKKDLENAITEVSAKKDLSALSKIRLENYSEGKAAQIMHLGPFSEEGPTIEKIHLKIKELGGKFDGKIQKHHEIYLSDIRRVDPKKMKTVIRQPFKQ